MHGYHVVVQGASPQELDASSALWATHACESPWTAALASNVSEVHGAHAAMFPLEQTRLLSSSGSRHGSLS